VTSQLRRNVSSLRRCSPSCCRSMIMVTHYN
jgi:hypothetical protein